MTDEEKAKLEAEKQANGGETIEKETTGKTAEELAVIAAKNGKIAEDQRLRAEKAEAALKTKTDAEAAEAKRIADAKKAEEDKNKSNQTPTDPIEVARLAKVFADLDDDQTATLLNVVKATGKTPAEAKKDPLFTAWNNQYVEAQKKEKAKLGGGKGSSQGEGDDDEAPVKSGMKRDDHKSAAAKMGVR